MRVPSTKSSNRSRAERDFIRCALIFFIAALTAVALAPLPAHARRPRAPHPSDEESATATSGLNEPYAAAVAMEPVSGTIIFDKDMHRQWPTASLAKMMLMLIVARKIHDGSLKLDDRVTTSRRAADMGGSQVYLKEGETFSLDDMMKAVVVHSANDASLAVAEYVAGSAEAFVVMMNQQAAALGMKDTHYYSVHGLPPAEGQQTDVSSAYDLALLARELVKYPDVLRWSAIDTAPFRNGTFQLRNTNHLVRTFPGCDGLKTGFYYKAGFNVVATAQRNGMRLIAVVLGSPRKNENFKQAAVLMSEGFANYEMRQVAKPGAAIARPIAVKGGAVSTITPIWGGNASVFVKRDNPGSSITIDYKLPASLAAPIRAGQEVGTGEIVVGGKLQQEIPLLAPSKVAEGSLV